MGRGEGVPSSNLIFHQVQNTGEEFLRAVLLGAAEDLGDILQYRLVAEQVVMLKDHGAHVWNTSGPETFDNSGRSDGGGEAGVFHGVLLPAALPHFDK